MIVRMNVWYNNWQYCMQFVKWIISLIIERYVLLYFYKYFKKSKKCIHFSGFILHITISQSYTHIAYLLLTYYDRSLSLMAFLLCAFPCGNICSQIIQSNRTLLIYVDRMASRTSVLRSSAAVEISWAFPIVLYILLFVRPRTPFQLVYMCV